MKKVLVAFNDNEYNGRVTGDSAYGPQALFAYEDGMTFEFACKKYLDTVYDNWYPEADISFDDFLEEFGEGPTGFWIVDEKIHDIINDIDYFDFGGDSATYACMSLMKTQIQSAAEDVLTSE